MGHGAGGLLVGRGELALLHARARALPGLPLGRGRPPRHHRPRMPPLLRRRALERTRPLPQGAALRPDERRGQPRGGRQGVPFLHGLDADALVAERALQVPAGGLSLRAAQGRGQGPDAGRPGVRALGHGHLRRGAVFRRQGRVRQGGPRRHLHPDHGGQPRARSAAALHLLPTLWFRNTWSWGCRHEGCGLKPGLRAVSDGARPVRPRRRWAGCSSMSSRGRTDPRRSSSPRTRPTPRASSAAPTPRPTSRTRSATASSAGAPTRSTRPAKGTKCSAHFTLDLGAGGGARPSGCGSAARGRSGRAGLRRPVRADARRRGGARPTSSMPRCPGPADPEARRVARQAYAGLLWSKQFYHYVVEDWLKGDPNLPPPPPASGHRAQQRLAAPLLARRHLDARQVGISLVRRVGPRVPHDSDGARSTRRSPRSS